METKGSLQRLQKLLTCPYPEPEQSSPYYPISRPKQVYLLIMLKDRGTIYSFHVSSQRIV